jgi:hypothetical protein
MLDNPKAYLSLMSKYMKEVNAADLSRTKCEFVAVVSETNSSNRWRFANKLFEQTKKSSSELKERWTY